MQDLPLSLLNVPLSQLVLAHEPIGGVHIDFGEQEDQPIGDVEPVLVVEVVLGVHEVLPLGLRLVAGRRVVVDEVGVGVLEVLHLPLLVLAAALDLGDEGVEGDGVVVVGRGAGEVGAEPEAAVAVGGGVVVLGSAGEEEEEHDGYGDVHEDGGSAHCID